MGELLSYEGNVEEDFNLTFQVRERLIRTVRPETKKRCGKTEMFQIASQIWVLQLLQEEMGVIKCYNLKPGGDKILVTRQNRKGESSSHKGEAGLKRAV